MNKPKLIVPKHVWDGAQAEKKKNEVEKIHTGFAGPATKEYQKFKEDFDKIVTELLSEV